MSETTQLEERAVGLVHRAQAGEPAAREELLTCCHGTIRRWARVLTDDVAQEVMIRVALRPHRYAGRSRFTTWLYQVTRHTALSLRRRLTRRLRLIGGMPERMQEDHGLDPSAHAEASELRRVVGELFRELPLRQREVFYRVDTEGNDAVDIALRLGLRPVTVRAHLFRARRALRSKILQRHGYAFISGIGRVSGIGDSAFVDLQVRLRGRDLDFGTHVVLPAGKTAVLGNVGEDPRGTLILIVKPELVSVSP